MEQGGESLSPKPPWFTLEERLFISGFGPDPSDGMGIEADLGEQFFVGGDIEFEVCVEHGLVSCSGGSRFRHGDRETASLSMPGVRPAFA